MYGKFSLLLFGLVGLFSACSNGQEWQMVWSDEFEYEGLPDSTKWSYDVGDGCPNVCGWGNNEMQAYAAKRLKNSRVSDGILTIEAHKEPYMNKGYSSARLVSKNKGDWKYGRIETRAKLPSGIGTWPAIWMLPTKWEYGGWPESGEIDIMEHVGYNPDSVFATVHTKSYNHGIGTQKGGEIFKPEAENEFHTFAIEWSADKIDFFLNETQYFSFKNEEDSFKEWPFDKQFHLLLNIAVGGNWGGRKGVDQRIWPQKMEIDFVRVYQRNETVKAQSQ